MLVLDNSGKSLDLFRGTIRNKIKHLTHINAILNSVSPESHPGVSLSPLFYRAFLLYSIAFVGLQESI
jgi:hypothetical protein